jgi:hypothetical protein
MFLSWTLLWPRLLFILDKWPKASYVVVFVVLRGSRAARSSSRHQVAATPAWSAYACARALHEWRARVREAGQLPWPWASVLRVIHQMFAGLASLVCTIACGCVQQERQSHGYTRGGAVEAGDERRTWHEMHDEHKDIYLLRVCPQ